MKLVVGLGNPGQGYSRNRHNLGFMCVSHFAKEHGIKFDKKQGQARTGTGDIGGETVVVARPETYMNQSGQAVSRLVKRSNSSLDDLIVIHDDLDLPVGRIRIRQGGSAGGHRGIESIITGLGSKDFLRIRVGIGRPSVTGSGISTPEDAVIAYVLSGFTLEEKKIIDRTIPEVSEAIESLITGGLAVAMNKYNREQNNSSPLTGED